MDQAQENIPHTIPEITGFHYKLKEFETKEQNLK